MKPDKPAPPKQKETVVIQLRTVPADLHRALRISAMDAEVSMENYIITILCNVMKQGGCKNEN